VIADSLAVVSAPPHPADAAEAARGSAPADGSAPAHWSADVLLIDGTVAHLRPIGPADAQLLVRFYEQVSEQSKYLRFFAPYPQLSRRDVARFTGTDNRDRVGLIVTVGTEMVAIGRFDRVGASGTDAGARADVAFLVQDAHQGRGLASVLLEHLAVIARERGISAFVASVLPGNERMVRVFTDAGYTVRDHTEDEVTVLDFALEPTAGSLAVTREREQQAEARSVQRMLRPAAVAVVGASREPGKVGHQLVQNLLAADPGIPVYPVGTGAGVVAGVSVHQSVRDIPGPVDLAVVAVPAEAVAQVVQDCAAKAVHALVVVSGGFADSGPEGERRTADLLERTRRSGMRVLGPASLGIVSHSPDGSLNASLAAHIPAPGGIAMFSQSGALGIGILQRMRSRGLGLSSFVSAGNRLDVSVNDMLQYWDSDESTDLILLYLESVGNPRKFSRLARRVGRHKPVVSVRVGRTVAEIPAVGQTGPGTASREAVEAVFAQAGVLLVDTLTELFDVAAVLARQPLPRSQRVALIGNSRAQSRSVADAAIRAGLDVGSGPTVLSNSAGAAEYAAALQAAVSDPAVGSVVVFLAPTLGMVEAEVAAAVVDAARSPEAARTTVVSASLGARVAWSLGSGPQRTVPQFPSVEEALRALAVVVRYAHWRETPAGRVPEIAGVDLAAARGVVGRARHADDAAARTGHLRLDPAQLGELLGAFGIRLQPETAVGDAAAATAAARAMWSAGAGAVVLRAGAVAARTSPDQRDVRRDLTEPAAVAEAFGSLADAYGGPVAAGISVQPQAPPGIPVTVELRQDPAFGAIVSFGLAGVASELLGDRSYRIPPLTDRDADSMIRAIRAAPLLFGYQGRAGIDAGALAGLLHRVSALAEGLPGVSELSLDPVLAGSDGISVLRASATVTATAQRPDSFRRQLPTTVG